MSAIEQDDRTKEPPPAAATPRGKPAGLRRWLYRLAALTLIPVAVFALLEGSLRVAGYGLDTSFFLDGTRVEKRKVWIENQHFNRWVFPGEMDAVAHPVPFVLPRAKKEGTYRIFVLGESAAMGFPEPAFSFARVLEVMLRARYPDVRFEVVNTAMTAINSHVVLPIARQCVRQRPDLFVVHLGNNEVVGPFGAAGVLGPFTPSRGFVQANLAMKATRTGQLVHHLLRKLRQRTDAPQVWNGMGTFANSHVHADDTRLERIYDHFRENLEDICRAGTDAGVPVVVCTIPVNLKDSAPFGSRHNPNRDDEQTATWQKAYQAGVRHEERGQYSEAIRQYQQAARIDDQFADLAFRLGRCYGALGKKSEAKEYFVRARDLDTLRFRTDTTINRTIREVLAGQNDDRVRLADAEGAFERSSPNGIPGEELFLEHVHMNFKGNCLMARTVFECITDLAPPALGEGWGDKAGMLSDEQCAEQLGYTQWNELRIAKTILASVTMQRPFTMQLDHLQRGKRWTARVEQLRKRLNSGAVTKCLAGQKKAVESNPEDWMMRLALADLLSEFKNTSEAEEQLVQAQVRLRHDPTIRYRIGQLHLKAGRLDAAASQFREALRLAPDFMSANFGLAEFHAARGEVAQAVAVYQEQLRKGENRLLALLTLGQYYDKIGKRDESREQYLEVLRCSPENVGALVSLGHIAVKQEKWDEAIEYYEAVMRIWPQIPGVHEGLIFARKNRKQEQ